MYKLAASQMLLRSSQPELLMYCTPVSLSSDIIHLFPLSLRERLCTALQSALNLTVDCNYAVVCAQIVFLQNIDTICWLMLWYMFSSCVCQSIACSVVWFFRRLENMSAKAKHVHAMCRLCCVFAFTIQRKICCQVLLLM